MSAAKTAAQLTQGLIAWEPVARSVAAGFRLPGADRDDVQQEAMIGLWHGLEAYDGRGTQGAFLGMAVKRHLTDKLRTATRLKSRMLTNTVRDDALAAHAGPDPFRGLADREAVTGMLAPLTLVERRAVVGVAAGCEYAELGEFKSIDNALTRARRKLRAAA